MRSGVAGRGRNVVGSESESISTQLPRAPADRVAPPQELDRGRSLMGWDLEMREDDGVVCTPCVYE
jgi:hypothetical protein